LALNLLIKYESYIYLSESDHRKQQQIVPVTSLSAIY